MPDGNLTKAQSLQKKREWLLKKFTDHLDDLLVQRCIPQTEGVPFDKFEGDPPQVVAIKKLINSLYYAEKASGYVSEFNKDGEGDENEKKGLVAQIGDGFAAKHEAVLLINMLNEACPEIRKIIADDYSLLKPLYTQSYKMIEKSGWFSDFMEMDVTDKASKMITVLGLDVMPLDQKHPLIVVFIKISKLVELLSSLQDKDIAEKDKEHVLELIRSLFTELNNHPFISQLSVADLKNSKMIHDLFGWFKRVEKDNFTQDSLQKYISWANHYLPELILLADNIEQKNYLKIGSLSTNLCSKADHLREKMNSMSDSQSIRERVFSRDSLRDLREQQFNAIQTESVQTILAVEKQQAAAAEFYKILQGYKGASLEQIKESDRAKLRALYPKIQMALAHTPKSERRLNPKKLVFLGYNNLKLENQLAAVLNTKGPEKVLNTKAPETDPPTPQTKFQSIFNTAKKLAKVVKNVVDDKTSSVDKVIKTENAVGQFMTRDIDSARFKVLIAEKAREQLSLENNTKEQLTLEEKGTKRIAAIKKVLESRPVQPEPDLKGITPIQCEDLVNLSGALKLIQNKKLSTKIKEIRDILDALAQRHYKDNSDLLEQIKKVETNLSELECSFKEFEQLNLSFEFNVLNLHAFEKIGSAVERLKISMKALTPETQKTLAPLLKQIIAYGHSFSPLGLIGGADAFSLKQLEESGEKPSQKNAPELFNLANKLANVRTTLLERLQTTLSQPLSTQLNPQEKGVPFVELKNDPPQIAVIKKIINSIYYAENALKVWNGIDANTFIAAHQVAPALFKVYKSLSLIAEASPEIQMLIREQDDLIKPIFEQVNKIRQHYGWINRISTPEDVAKKAGSIMGQWINSIRTDTTQPASLVGLVTKLPGLMNDMSRFLDLNTEKSVDELNISDHRIKDLDAMYKLVFEKKGSYIQLLRGFGAIRGLIDLYGKIRREGTNLQETTIRRYQKWLEEDYPQLVMMLDELETRYYLAPGFLSYNITLELDQINYKLNELSDQKKENKLKIIPLSFDMGKIRTTELNSRMKEHLLHQFEIETQQEAVVTFFAILKKYADQTLTDISIEDLTQLRLAFVSIQHVMANQDLDLTNRFTVLLNQLELSTFNRPHRKLASEDALQGETEHRTGVYTQAHEDSSTVSTKQVAAEVEFPKRSNKEEHTLSIPSLMKLERSVDDYLNERKKAYVLKIDVIEQAIAYVKSKSKPKPFDLQPSEKLNMGQLRQQFLEDENKKPKVASGELPIIAASSLTSGSGNLAFIQELKLSSSLAKIREGFSLAIQEHFSILLQDYLTKTPTAEQVHVIHDTDPQMVQQIKTVENALYHVEKVLQVFEGMNKENRLVPQAQAILELVDRARQLNLAIKHFTPELIEHYGPLLIEVTNFAKKIQSIEFNREDWADLKFILDGAHRKLLTRKKPGDEFAQKAFREAGVFKEAADIDRTESIKKKGLRLGIKYTYRLSPELARAKAYLYSKYGKVLGEPDDLDFTRKRLADKNVMQAEINRLYDVLEKKYGFNFKTAKVLIELIVQIQRTGAQAGELAGLVNTLVKDDFSKIKENAYREFILKLSQEEDYLCLKPGTLLHPAIAVLNQLFLSMALELEMPFSKKLALLDEKRYINSVLEETAKEIKVLEHELAQQKTSPSELLFKINIKKDKLAFLEQQNALFNKDIKQTKEALLDIQFGDVILRDHLKKSTLKSPILQQYEQSVRQHYFENKAKFLQVEECSDAVRESLEQFQKEKLADYLLVCETYIRLKHFSSKLSHKNQDLKNYIQGINNILINKDASIEVRALTAKSLPKDKEFRQKLSAADQGTSFLKQLIHFFKIIIASIYEAIKTRGNLVDLYRKNLMEQRMKNIEQSARFFKAKEEKEPTGEFQLMPRGPQNT